MELSYTKILAWFIVVAGLAVIGWSIFSSYDFFTGKKDFPEVFKPSVEQAQETPAVQKTADVSTAKTQAEAQAIAQAAVQEQIQQSMSENISKMFPADSVFKLSNMTAWIAFATFLVFAGGQISSIGAKILANKS
jgi:hypothetical protein